MSIPIKNTKQVYWFIIVGTIGFIVDAFLLEIILRNFEIGMIFGRLLSFSVAVTVTWLLNRHYTFRQATHEHKNLKGLIQEFFMYLLASSASISINIGIYMLCVFSFEICYEKPFLAVGIGSIGAMVVTFLVSKYWVFK